MIIKEELRQHKIKKNKTALKKYDKNKKALDYLNSNPFISEKSVYKYMMNIWLIIIFYIHHI